MSPPPTVDVVLPVCDGTPYLEEQVESLVRQTHRAWRLWVRDDGSTDRSPGVLRRLAGSDPRIHLHPSGGDRLGATGSFAWLLEHLPDDARYAMCCDQDDVWIAEKIERSLDAMLEAEAERPEPVLLHTDLAVTDADLRVVHPSFWTYQGIRPQPARLERLMVDDTVTGCTVLVNRALLDRALPIPEEAEHHDRWLARVAAITGRVVSLPEATVLYRQHGENVVGAERRTGSPLFAVRKAFSPERARRFRESLRATAREARVLLDRFGSELDPDETRTLARWVGLPDLGPMRRKLRVARLRAVAGTGLPRALLGAVRA